MVQFCCYRNPVGRIEDCTVSDRTVLIPEPHSSSVCVRGGGGGGGGGGSETGKVESGRKDKGKGREQQ